MDIASASDLLIRLGQAHSDDDDRMLLGMLTHHFGFEHFTFWAGAQALGEEQTPPLLTNWPDEFSPTRTDRRNCFQSVLVRHAVCSSRAVALASLDLEQDRHLPIYAIVMQTRQRRLDPGLCLPIWHKDRLKGVATFIGRDGPLPVEDTTAMHMLVMALHRKRIERGTHSNAMVLTDREREVLRWTAAGKTAAEIAIILDLSARTVESYLQKAAERLGTVNRTHTVAEALRRGLI